MSQSVPSRSDQVELARVLSQRLIGRQLIEAGDYPDAGERSLMLVFASRPDQSAVDPEHGDDVDYSISISEDWLLLSDGRVVARRGDSTEIDSPGFEPVLRKQLLRVDIREEDFVLSLTFADGYHLIVVTPPSNELDRDEWERWSITTPDGVASLIGDQITI